METLESLAEFTNKYPQGEKEPDKLNYIFIGGTAVRLTQELIDDSPRRVISDFDLLTFISGKYPVHNFDIGTLFGNPEIETKEILPYISSVNIFGRDYHFSDSNLTTVSKTCITDPVREKDFNDVFLLNNNGLLNQDYLKDLYQKSARITKNSELVVDVLDWLISEKTDERIKLFGTFPRMVNLLNDLPDFSLKDSLLSYSSSERKNSYQISSVFYDIHSFLREVPFEERGELLKPLLSKASRNDYSDFDRFVHNELIPSYRYGNSEKRERLIKNLKDYS